eukprot:m.83141 g.83141  ORF g.83141 m.83141 type:complete len:64 (-) comp8289_c0_seq3:684-875(-)
MAGRQHASTPLFYATPQLNICLERQLHINNATEFLIFNANAAPVSPQCGRATRVMVAPQPFGR